MIDGSTMIERVYRQVMQANLSAVYIATDDARIYDHVTAFGAKAVMTSETCQNGTERCAEVLQKEGIQADIVVNIQGDEPFIQPEQIDSVAAILVQNNEFQIATLKKSILTEEDLFNPNIVKVVTSISGKALYFSRQTIPFLRDIPQDHWLSAHPFYKHIGLYAYRAAILPTLAQLVPSPLETVEKLEQLRWLEADLAIGVGETNYETIGIDTPQDLERILGIL
jgi:3-deoxy-manno-octulosonate cytidylyltransferase (CMP-KDO synthetase)